MTQQDERDQKLRKSLPNLNEETTPYFPKLQLKKGHPWLPYGMLAGLIIVFGIFCSLFVIAKVDGDSMDNTLHDGQWLMLQRSQAPKRFDIVVLHERQTPDGPQKDIIKRVIGLPGDTVTVMNGQLFINNHRYFEPYVSANHAQQYDKVNWTIKVPKNHIFVLGDNRDISRDSRAVGSFDKSAILGIKL